VANAAGEPRSVRAAPPIEWVVRVPGSKSLTNRALVLAAMARGRTRLVSALRSGDTDALSAALARLGIPVEPVAGSTEAGTSPGRWPGFEVSGTGGAFEAGADVTLDLGDGGTPTRFAMALASFSRRRVTIDGSARMRERPVADGVELLRILGVPVEYREAQGRLPVMVDGRAGPPRGGSLQVGALASSQFVSALLLLAPWMRDGLELRFEVPPVSGSYIELTIDELRRWGAAVGEARDGDGLRTVRVDAGPLAARGEVFVEPDASSALYWAAAAALVPGSDVILHGLPPGSRQPDRAAIDLLGAMGAEVVRDPACLRVRCGRRAGDGAAPLAGIRASLEACPDGALMLIAAAAVARGPSRFEGLGTLRVKESDRLAAMAEGLARVGATARIGDDWIEVDPVPAGHRVDAAIDPHRDHRIAMSFAVLGLRSGGIRIGDPGCVAKSYPEFWTALGRCERGGG
jgi:3-phosphoshikimate 1-carboxyvinyltransferase